ncbi:UNVERIFIED_CONTAM: hypothetical protein Sradi_4239700 [Sesamum radiatum]|uniref:Uncharacterized protein n=1 Tax=Sesamum radiatum TaxID=300843 RepID=A0AAW2P6V2_SESRA
MQWLHKDWQRGIMWATAKWWGKHYVQAAIVYHKWRERNYRRFMTQSRTANQVVEFVLEEMRQRILSENLTTSLQTIALYRLWRIA